MNHSVYGHVIEIWEPRYKDKKVLIARHNVQEGWNYITFTKAEHLKGKVFAVHSDNIWDQHLQANGRGEVYCVPMEFLTLKGHLSDTAAQLPNEETRYNKALLALKRLGYIVIDKYPESGEFWVEGKKGESFLRLSETQGEVLSWTRSSSNVITLTPKNHFTWNEPNDIIGALEATPTYTISR